ncbi:hypothetical protein [Flavobacterium psychrotrophum]|uniref:hypothetical protein n=1 Tax=Flavobacterium psychrotrophum TaxID=2294119 RepID=UPI000E30FCEF|nr:hypothetical protein [Flavobacterium psychrotrophum]
MKNLFLIICTVSFLYSCNSTLPATSGEKVVAYGYQPLDPLPVDVKVGASIVDPLSKHNEILNALGDETMRLAIREIDGSGGATYGPAKIGYKGHSYEVIMDYMKFQTYPKLFRYSKNNDDVLLFDLVENIPAGVTAINGSTPLYVGIGLRLTVNITVNEGSIDLGNLFALGIAAQAKKVSGSLVVQSLGISGDKITGLIPMPSEISPTSIQNAIMALATIKSKIYDTDTKITPRTIGFYNSLGGGKNFLNSFINNCLKGNAIIQF